MSYRTYGTIYTGTVDASMTAATEEVKRQLEDVYTHTVSVGEVSEKVATRSTRAFRGYVFGLQMGIFYMSMMTNAWMMAESAQLSLQDAQENYQRTLQEFGPAHEKTQAALRSLERAQIRVDRMWLRTGLTMAGLVLQTISYGYTLAVATGILGAHKAVTAASTTANVANTASIWGQVAALKAWIIAQATAHPYLAAGMIAGGAAAAGAVGYYLGGGFSGGGTTTVNYNVGGTVVVHGRDIDEALEEYKRRMKEEAERVTD